MSIRPRSSLLNIELQRPKAIDSISRDPGLIWLDKNENLDPVLLKISKEILESISPVALATYPEAGALYRKLAKLNNVDPDALLLTPGSDGVIRIVFDAFVENGDFVIHTSPTFAMYPVYCLMFGAKAIPIEYLPSEEGPYLNYEDIFHKIIKYKPKIICLPNPDSPTGTIIDPEVLNKILKLCELEDILMLVDEAYHPYYEWSALDWTKNSRNIVVARTFAKAWGVAGLRIGYAVGHPETISLLHKIRPMYESSTLAIEFMTRMLDFSVEMTQSVTRAKLSKIYFKEAMLSLGLPVLNSEGNFVHVHFGARGEDIHKALSNYAVYRKTFNHPSLLGYSRFSIAPQNEMSIIVDVIKNTISKTI